MDSRKTALFEINLGMATCDGLTEPYLPAVLTICDLIEAGDVLPSVVLDCIKTKLESAKEQQALLGLQVLENIVKNCGGCIRDELTKKAYCDVFHNLARTASHNSVKRKLLELIKTWDCVFGEKPQHINLIILLNTMKADGFIFPNLQVSKAMLALYDAPRAIQKPDMTRKRKLESVPTPTQITSQSKLHKQEHFYFGRFTPFFPVGQATSNAASSPSGQYNHEAMMLQTIRTCKESLLQLSKQNDLIGQNITKVASLIPSQTVPQNKPQTNLFPRQQNKPSTITSQLQPTTAQTLPQNKPQNNLFSLQQSKSSAITSQLQPITTQTLPQSQPQTDTIPQPEQIPPSTNMPGQRRPVRLTQKEKLELMRKKKQEFLKKQRELATQGNQEQ